MQIHILLYYAVLSVTLYDFLGCLYFLTSAQPLRDCLYGAIIPMDIPGIEPGFTAHKTVVLTTILYVLNGLDEFSFSMH